MKDLNKRLDEKARQLSMMLNNSSDSESEFTKKQGRKNVLKSARVVTDKAEALRMFQKDYNSMKAENSVDESYEDSVKKSSAKSKGSISARNS